MARQVIFLGESLLLSLNRLLMACAYTHSHFVWGIFLKAPSPLQATHHVDYGRFFLFSYFELSLKGVPIQVLIGSQAFPLKSSHVVSDRKLYLS